MFGLACIRTRFCRILLPWFLLQVVNAEALFTSFLANHNIPFNVNDHFSKLVSRMFPDSKIAAKYGCARTKSSAMVKGRLISLITFLRFEVTICFQ
jgi:hypothetical protein